MNCKNSVKVNVVTLWTCLKTVSIWSSRVSSTLRVQHMGLRLIYSSGLSVLQSSLMTLIFVAFAAGLDRGHLAVHFAGPADRVRGGRRRARRHATPKSFVASLGVDRPRTGLELQPARARGLRDPVGTGPAAEHPDVDGHRPLGHRRTRLLGSRRSGKRIERPFARLIGHQPSSSSGGFVIGLALGSGVRAVRRTGARRDHGARGDARRPLRDRLGHARSSPSARSCRCSSSPSPAADWSIACSPFVNARRSIDRSVASCCS